MTSERARLTAGTVTRGQRVDPPASPDPRPLTHPLWQGFKAHVVAAHLNPLVLVSSDEFDRHGRLLWSTYLAGAVATGWDEGRTEDTPLELVVPKISLREIDVNSSLRL